MDRQHAKETFQNIWEGLKLHLLRSIFCSSLKDWEKPASRANTKGTGNQSVRTGLIFYFFSFIFISWRLITLQYCSSFCHTLTWISHGFTWVPHPDPRSRLPPHPIPLGLPSAPAPRTCLMHPTWAELARARLKLKEPALWPPRLLGNLEAVQGQMQVSWLGQLILPALTGLEQSITCLLLSLKLYISYFGPYPMLQALLHDQVQNPFSLKEKELGNSFLWRVN